MSEVKCAFCSQPVREDTTLFIKAPRSEVYICEFCVDVSWSIVLRRRRELAQASIPAADCTG